VLTAGHETGVDSRRGGLPVLVAGTDFWKLIYADSFGIIGVVERAVTS
jgi:hypothetical protein